MKIKIDPFGPSKILRASRLRAGRRHFFVLAVLILSAAVFSVIQLTTAEPATPGVSHGADEVTPGSFQNGTYTFPGQVKITGGAPGAGKILTSDASGLASWQASAGGTLLTWVNSRWVK